MSYQFFKLYMNIYYMGWRDYLPFKRSNHHPTLNEKDSELTDQQTLTPIDKNMINEYKQKEYENKKLEKKKIFV